MKQWAGASLIALILAGCSTTPTEPVKPDGQARVTVNSASVIAEAMSDYYRLVARKKERAAPARVLTKLTVGQILEKCVPADFHVYTADDVDLATTIEYETSRPWIEALGKPLADAGIEMTADLDKKLMSLKVGTTTIAQVLERNVPEDYTVYADDAVDLNTPIKVDRSQNWVEAIGKALTRVDILMTANVDKKLILLRPKAMVRPEIKPQELEVKKQAVAPPKKQDPIIPKAQTQDQ